MSLILNSDTTVVHVCFSACSLCLVPAIFGATPRDMEKGPFYLYKKKYGLGLEDAMKNVDMQGILWPEADQFQNECEGHCGI